MSRALLLPLILLALCAWVSPASAGKRVALIIGNSAYRNVPQLVNPANDAKLIASTLKAAGFDLVDLRADLTAGDMRRALRDFGDQAKNADVAVIYYAGHGIEVDGNNYLIPTDAVLERDTDVYDEALSLDRVLVAIEPAKQLRLVILDACRDNPFGRNMKQASRSIERGLAKIEPNSPNTLIAFSAKAGSTANDGDGGNSPFTQALAKRIATPGLDVRRAFGFVRDDVLKVTSNRQEPYVYGSLGGEDVPLVPAKLEPAVAPAVSQADSARKDYELAVQVGTPDGWNAFLSQYPTGFYANLARAQLNKLTAEQAQRDAEERARIARDAQARLAAQNATKVAQANADATANAAEQARAEAERKRVVANAVVADAERAAPLADTTRQASDSANTQKMAALPPVAPPPVDSKALTRRLQSELARVGCYDGAADGNWTTKTRSALDNFNRRAGTSFDPTEASADAIDAVHRRDGKVCVAARSDEDAKPAKRREQPEKRVQQSKRSSGGRCFVMSGQSFCQ